MSSSLARDLAALPQELRSKLERSGFDPALLERLALQLKQGFFKDNFIKAPLSPPRAGDLLELPAAGSSERAALEARGAEALRQGRVALVVLAGGMATRMGGVVKALVEVSDGLTFLELRYQEIKALERRFGVAPPLWLMTSEPTDAPIRKALGARHDGQQIAAFRQNIALRLTPEGELFRDASGAPSEYAPGHGDLPDALQRSGLLRPFLARGGKTVMMTNLDNFGGTLDPLLIGLHLQHGAEVSCEVVDKLTTDRGGIPAYVGEKLCILEEFRIPPSFDPAQVRVFSTNVFHFDARALADLSMKFSYFAVRKQAGNEPVVQFERLINEVTAVLPTRYLKVPRSGTASRFLPVKDTEELELRRDEILTVARARGILS